MNEVVQILCKDRVKEEEEKTYCVQKITGNQAASLGLSMSVEVRCTSLVRNKLKFNSITKCFNFLNCQTHCQVKYLY